jgi:hypothetical protein
MKINASSSSFSPELDVVEWHPYQELEVLLVSGFETRDAHAE